jgi:hypothetical protein
VNDVLNKLKCGYQRRWPTPKRPESRCVFCKELTRSYKDGLWVCVSGCGMTKWRHPHAPPPKGTSPDLVIPTRPLPAPPPEPPGHGDECPFECSCCDDWRRHMEDAVLDRSEPYGPLCFVCFASAQPDESLCLDCGPVED